MGVARSDPDAIMAVPEVTLSRDKHTVERIRALVDEWSAIIVYVGLPRTLSGGDGLAAQAAREMAEHIQSAVECPVRLVDERLSTVEAQRALRDAGRGSKKSRSVIDQAAAVLILEHALSLGRAAGTPAGLAVTVDDGGREEGGR